MVLSAGSVIAFLILVGDVIIGIKAGIEYAKTLTFTMPSWLKWGKKGREYEEVELAQKEDETGDASRD